MSDFQSPDFLLLFIFYYSEDLIGVENIFLNLNRSRMLIASKLTLFSCQNSSKSFHAAKASCTNMRHLPTGSIRFQFMQGPCGSHKLMEVMLTHKKRKTAQEVPGRTWALKGWLWRGASHNKRCSFWFSGMKLNFSRLSVLTLASSEGVSD